MSVSRHCYKKHLSLEWMHILLLSLTGVMSFGCAEERFPIGRDTVKSFGDGQFQIMRSGSVQFFLDCESQRSIAFDISDWRREGNVIYLREREGEFVRFDLSTLTEQRYTRIAAIPLNERSIFVRLHE